MKTLTEDLIIESIETRKAGLIYRALNHKLRQQMLELLHKKGQSTVTDLYVKLRLYQSVASQHLAILRQARCVNTQRDGKFIYYSVNYERISEIHQTANNLNRLN